METREEFAKESKVLEPNCDSVLPPHEDTEHKVYGDGRMVEFYEGDSGIEVAVYRHSATSRESGIWKSGVRRCAIEGRDSSLGR